MITRSTFLALILMCASARAAGNTYTTPQQVFDAMRQNFQPQKAQGVRARYQFEIHGPHGGDWWIEVRDGKCKIDKGKIDNPSVTLAASDKDWVALSNGTLSGIWATLMGRLKVHGDVNLARKLDEMFP